MTLCENIGQYMHYKLREIVRGKLIRNRIANSKMDVRGNLHWKLFGRERWFSASYTIFFFTSYPKQWSVNV